MKTRTSLRQLAKRVELGQMWGMTVPLITIAIPSYNHADFLEDALRSIDAQNLPVEIMLADGGSTDGTPAIIARWAEKLTWWRSGPDAGQAAAINEAITQGRAPYVCWLNSDDYFLPGGLKALLDALEANPDAPAAYGQALFVDRRGGQARHYRTEPFSFKRLAWRCFISQPATLIRREAWEAVAGTDPSLHLAMDYDLWWKLARKFGPLLYVRQDIAATRLYAETKTMSQRKKHYRQAIDVVRRHAGYVPWKWYLAWPYSVTFKSLLAAQK